jgi:hypothetical protein
MRTMVGEGGAPAVLTLGSHRGKSNVVFTGSQFLRWGKFVTPLERK